MTENNIAESKITERKKVGMENNFLGKIVDRN